MTKQQIIDQLNKLTDDPNREIFGFWDDGFWKIHDISIQTHNRYGKFSPYSQEFSLVDSCKKICIDCR